MTHLYNEIEPNAVEWLKNLAFMGEIPSGGVDARPIQQITGDDLRSVVQFHTFTGSCPCQPYSSAGKQKGNADERNLWPDFFRLIAERRPKYVFGEQVASAIKHGWIDRVQTDLEGIGYSVGYAVLGAHSVGANHIRQRLYWGAALGAVVNPVRGGTGHAPGQGVGTEATADGENGDLSGERLRPGVEGSALGLAQDPSGLRRRGRDVRRDEGDTGELEPQGEAAGSGVGGGVSDRDENGRSTRSDERGSTQARDGAAESVAGPISRRELVRLADDDERLQVRGEGRPESDGSTVAPGGGPWSDFALVLCTDGKARRTGSRVFPLAYGLPRGVGNGGAWRKGLARSASRARIGILKGSGNGIVSVLGAQFVLAFMESL